MKRESGSVIYVYSGRWTKTGASAFSPSAIKLLLIFIVKESHCTPFPF